LQPEQTKPLRRSDRETFTSTPLRMFRFSSYSPAPSPSGRPSSSLKNSSLTPHTSITWRPSRSLSLLCPNMVRGTSESTRKHPWLTRKAIPTFLRKPWSRDSTRLSTPHRVLRSPRPARRSR
jgi:hypothetical protein